METTGAEAEEGWREAQAELTQSARTLIDQVRRTRAPASALARVRAALDEAAALLAPHAHEGAFAQAHLLGEIGGFDAAGDPMDYFPYSPIIGHGNPIAPPVTFRVEDGVVHGVGTFGPAYCGPPNHVHGGIVAAVLDELLGTVNVVNGVGAMTGTLTIRYRRPTPLHTEIRMEGHTAGVEGRKVHAEGKMWAGDELLAEAHGVFIQIGEAFRDRLKLAPTPDALS